MAYRIKVDGIPLHQTYVKNVGYFAFFGSKKHSFGVTFGILEKSSGIESVEFPQEGIDYVLLASVTTRENEVLNLVPQSIVDDYLDYIDSSYEVIRDVLTESQINTIIDYLSRPVFEIFPFEPANPTYIQLVGPRKTKNNLFRIWNKSNSLELVINFYNSSNQEILFRCDNEHPCGNGNYCNPDGDCFEISCDGKCEGACFGGCPNGGDCLQKEDSLWGCFLNCDGKPCGGGCFGECQDGECRQIGVDSDGGPLFKCNPTCISGECGGSCRGTCPEGESCLQGKDSLWGCYPDCQSGKCEGTCRGTCPSGEECISKENSGIPNFECVRKCPTGECKEECPGTCPAGESCILTNGTYSCETQCGKTCGGDCRGTCPKGFSCIEEASFWECKEDIIEEKTPVTSLWWFWLLLIFGILILLVGGYFFFRWLRSPKLEDKNEVAPAI